MFDPKQNEIWSLGGKVWNNIDIAEARDIANDFKIHQTDNSNGKVITEVTFNSQECKEPTMTELELWFSSQDFRTEFDKVEDTIYNNDSRIEIVLNINHFSLFGPKIQLSFGPKI